MGERWERHTVCEQFNDLLRSEIAGWFSRYVRTIASGDCPHISAGTGHLCTARSRPTHPVPTTWRVTGRSAPLLAVRRLLCTQNKPLLHLETRVTRTRSGLNLTMQCERSVHATATWDRTPSEAVKPLLNFAPCGVLTGYAEDPGGPEPGERPPGGANRTAAQPRQRHSGAKLMVIPLYQ